MRSPGFVSNNRGNGPGSISNAPGEMARFANGLAIHYQCLPLFARTLSAVTF